MTKTQIEAQIFNVDQDNFLEMALLIFHYQYQNTAIYKQYIDAIGVHPSEVTRLTEIPFLPIQFFKSHQVISKLSSIHDMVFESSGTTGQVSSKHIVSDLILYKTSFRKSFDHFFGEVSDYCILGLLPSYLERGQSSLVYMMDDLIKESKHLISGFYLNNYEALYKALNELEEAQQPSLLFGVTYALLDFADQFKLPLKFTKIIETGGMKGRREELIRDEVHAQLSKSFSLVDIYSEYGMTELLSQAYSLGKGVFEAPDWMRFLIRDVNDPFNISSSGKGILNIIDLANLHSCSFIATDDIGEVFENQSFRVDGRLDYSDLRGCSLLTI